MTEEDELVLHKLREELDAKEMSEGQGRIIWLETRLRECESRIENGPLPFLGILIPCTITMVITVAICWWLM